MSAQHTPGEWLLAGSDDRFVYALNAQGCNRFWAHVQGGMTGPGEHTKDEELEANGRLIGAAPDLLEALQLLMGPLESMVDNMNAAQKARAAINKATGQTQ